MDMWSANQFRCSRGLRVLCSACVSRVGFCVAPKQASLKRDTVTGYAAVTKVRDREDAFASTRDACATQARIKRPSYKASELAKQRIVDTLHRIMAKTTYPTLSISKAQSGLPKLCRDKKAILITTHEKPVSVLLPIEDYEALIETMDLLANPTAMRTLRAAKAGKLRYRRLNLDDEDFGL
jgi:PHD/YefM family antitoxin component YafN of YafNO toxin-antitoxin module